MKIYYELKESLGLAADALREFGHQIASFPMYQYMYDAYDKIPNYCEKFIEYIKNNSFDYILWWFISIPTSDFIRIKLETGAKYLLFNWDDPFNWKLADLESKSAYFEAVFVTCNESKKWYLDNGTKLAYCLYPAFSPRIHYPPYQISENEYNKYCCDISFCCTNLYEDDTIYPNQYINRKVLIDAIYHGQKEYNYVFHIYGPEKIGEIYPDSYRGFISYHESHLVFGCSKINLCTHGLGEVDGYLNERVFIIGGSGGLLLVDNPKGLTSIFDPETEVIIIDRENYLPQIREILDNYQEYAPRKENLYQKCLQKYSYRQWAETITNGIKELAKK
jgi:hypothetical protein